MSGDRVADALIERVKQACVKRGVTGFKGLSRAFRLYDDDRSKTLDMEEFRTGLKMYGVKLDDKESQFLFDYFDQDNSGGINFDEFLTTVRGKALNSTREDMVKKAFNKIDTTGDNLITIEDLKNVYNVQHHPKYINGEMTRKQILNEFLQVFQVDKSTADDKVTWEEFVNYYALLSANIDQDAYFCLMMTQSWGI